jgi:hypothetical protein
LEISLIAILNTKFRKEELTFFITIWLCWDWAWPYADDNDRGNKKEQNHEQKLAPSFTQMLVEKGPAVNNNAII